MAFKRLLSADDIKKIKEKSEYLTINPDVEGDDYRSADNDSHVEKEEVERSSIDVSLIPQ